MIYSEDALDRIHARTLLGDSDCLILSKPKLAYAIIQKLNGMLDHPLKFEELFEMECVQCGSFCVNAEAFYRFCSVTSHYYYKHSEMIDKELPDAEATLDELTDVARAIAVPLVYEGHEEKNGINTGDDEWDYDQNEGWPIVLKTRSIWLGDTGCASCRGLLKTVGSGSNSGRVGKKNGKNGRRS